MEGYLIGGYFTSISQVSDALDVVKGIVTYEVPYRGGPFWVATRLNGGVSSKSRMKLRGIARRKRRGGVRWRDLQTENQ